MPATINFAAAQSAFAAAVAGLEQVTAVSPEKTARLDKILARIEADAKLAARVLSFKSARTPSIAVKAGDEVEFSVGRGETVRSGLRGTVIGVREKAEGVIPAVKIRVGSGFDEEIYTTHPGNVSLLGARADAEEESAELDLIEGVDVAGVYGADDIIG